MSGPMGRLGVRDARSLPAPVKTVAKNEEKRAKGREAQAKAGHPARADALLKRFLP